jgi:hypothetical protein
MHLLTRLLDPAALIHWAHLRKTTQHSSDTLMKIYIDDYWKKSKGKGPLKRPRLSGLIILNYGLEKENGLVWTRLVRLRIGSNYGLLWINCVALSPQAKSTDWMTATGQRILTPTFVDRGVSCGQSSWSPMVGNLSFPDWSRYFSFK